MRNGTYIRILRNLFSIVEDALWMLLHIQAFSNLLLVPMYRCQRDLVEERLC